jgi:hypothetical protein
MKIGRMLISVCLGVLFMSVMSVYDNLSTVQKFVNLAAIRKMSLFSHYRWV